jgi:hypothetical protein
MRRGSEFIAAKKLMSASTVYIALSVLGSLASIIGIPLALGAIRQARNAARRSAAEAEMSKNAALQAKEAVQKFKDELRVISDVIDLEKALALMEDIKGFIRGSTFGPVPDKIAGLIVILNAVRSVSLADDRDSQSVLQECIATLRRIEDAIDRSAISGAKPKGLASFNRTISEQIDQIQPILITLKGRIGEQT